MKHLTPQQQKVVDYLQSGEWKCMASVDFYMKDDRKRISELIEKGYVIEGEPCDSRANCGKQHSSKVKMRRLVEKPVQLKQQVTFKENPDGTRTAQLTLVPIQ